MKIQKIIILKKIIKLEEVCDERESKLQIMPTWNWKMSNFNGKNVIVDNLNNVNFFFLNCENWIKK
jgi:hypothetical protein